MHPVGVLKDTHDLLHAADGLSIVAQSDTDIRVPGDLRHQCDLNALRLKGRDEAVARAVWGDVREPKSLKRRRPHPVSEVRQNEWTTSMYTGKGPGARETD